MTIEAQMLEMAAKARRASRSLATLSTEQKNRGLRAMAEAIDRDQAVIRAENQKDLETAKDLGLSDAIMDRLALNEKRLASMASGLRAVAALPDPIGDVLEERVRPNGLRLQKVATPIGVIVMIYESRPNVTADAAGLCFKAGNATILRGGKEALNSNRCIARSMIEAATERCPMFPPEAIQLVPIADRAAVPALLQLTDYVDLCIPRGGEGLIRAVAECARVPVIKHYKGVCHVFVDAEADPAMAESIVLNAKTQRPGVCNALETLLVDRAIAREFLPAMGRSLAAKGVEVRADPSAMTLLAACANGAPRTLRLRAASESDWGQEYLDLILAVRVVDGVAEAIDHIHRYGSSHSESIVTSNYSRARRFLREVDSAAVYWNASTRFTDGAEFGMGAEIGISTDRIGARGPMGLRELTTYKWMGLGTGQIKD